MLPVENLMLSMLSKNAWPSVFVARKACCAQCLWCLKTSWSKFFLHIMARTNVNKRDTAPNMNIEFIQFHAPPAQHPCSPHNFNSSFHVCADLSPDRRSWFRVLVSSYQIDHNTECVLFQTLCPSAWIVVPEKALVEMMWSKRRLRGGRQILQNHRQTTRKPENE